MTTGIPKQPSIGSIVAGIALVIVAFLAFLRLSDVVKYSGAALMYIPAKLGLIDMVMPGDVIPIPLAENPTLINIPSPGRYIVYLGNLDLLSVHDAVFEGNSDPWIRIQPASQEIDLKITLIGRGLAWYDTPFAMGRPVAMFKIDQPGTYKVLHPTRPDNAYVVPDTLTGNESTITFWVITEILLIAWIAYIIVRRRTASRRQQRIDLREQNRARVEESRKRMQEKAEEKRKEEDLPHWKKR